jgi:hypothetical protein
MSNTGSTPMLTRWTPVPLPVPISGSKYASKPKRKSGATAAPCFRRAIPLPLATLAIFAALTLCRVEAVAETDTGMGCGLGRLYRLRGVSAALQQELIDDLPRMQQMVRDAYTRDFYAYVDLLEDPLRANACAVGGERDDADECLTTNLQKALGDVFDWSDCKWKAVAREWAQESTPTMTIAGRFVRTHFFEAAPT